MNKAIIICVVAYICTLAPAQDAVPEGSVASILSNHDRALLRALKQYIAANPRAADREQAYFSIFQTAIKNDWFLENQPAALAYLNESPEGAARPLARIVVVMAKAQTGDFTGAVADFAILIDGLGPLDDRDFVASFAEQLAGQATAAGEPAIARRVYEQVAVRFRDDAALRASTQAEIERLALVGIAAPDLAVRDLSGRTLRLRDLRGKTVFVDFWATYCVPSQNALPTLRSTYETLKKRGFEIVSISLDDTPEQVAEYVAKQNIAWPQIHNATCGADAVAAFKVRRLPASYLIDPEGRIVRLDAPVEKLAEIAERLINTPTQARAKQARTSK